MDLKNIGWENIDRNHVAQDSDWWQTLVNMIMKLQVAIRDGEFLD
jgi:hypothetical protein